MLKKLSILLFAFGIILQINVPVFAENVTKEQMEEVLLVQFHNQIVTALKEHYKVTVPQFENVKIASISKDLTPETSEGMKPGIMYEVKITLDASTSSGGKETLLLTLVNEDAAGLFKTISLKKYND